MQHWYGYLLIFILFLPTVVMADFDASTWQYQRVIELQSSQEAGHLAEVTFDAHVFAHAAQHLRDVRVIDESGTEIPFVLSVDKPRQHDVERLVSVASKGESEDGKHSFLLLDFGENPQPHNQISLITDDKNFRRRIIVEGSDDRVTWRTLAQPFVYGYSSDFDVSDTVVRYPTTRLRYVRLTILDNGQTPLAITGVQARFVEEVQARTVEYAAQIIRTEHDEERHLTQVFIDLGQNGLPTQTLVLNTPETNFNRVVRLEASENGEQWETLVYHDVIFSYDTDIFSGSKLSIEYPGTPKRFFRLTVFNYDNAPVQFSSSLMTGHLRTLLFSFEAEKHYKLMYGNLQAKFPVYDLERFVSYFDEANYVHASLGPEEVNPEYMPPIVPFSERFPYLLHTVLVLAVAVVGFILFQLLRQNSK